MNEHLLMIHRRTLLSLGGSALALSALGLAPVLAAPSPSVRFVVTDRRHLESVAFARQWASSASLEVTEGLTRLWREILLPHWQSDAPGAVAGLTTREVCACLAEQARSHGRLSTLCATPTPTTDSLVSWVIG